MGAVPLGGGPPMAPFLLPHKSPPGTSATSGGDPGIDAHPPSTLQLCQRLLKGSVRRLGHAGIWRVHIEDYINCRRDEERRQDEPGCRDGVARSPISETGEDGGQPEDHRGDQQRWDRSAVLVQHDPALLYDLSIKLARIVPDRDLLLI